MPRLTGGPVPLQRYADSYLDVALRYAHVPVKQAVISPSALSLMYPADEIPGYSREQFIDDLLREHETEVRSCLEKGAHKVQIDFTEGRLAVKIDPSGELLHSFIDLNNLALSRFSAEERKRIGVHTCPGGDRDSTHSADVDYAELLPSLFELKVGNFYIALAGEKDRVRVLKIIRDHLKPDQRVFVGVVAPIDPRVETPEEVRDRVLEAAQYIPVDQLGTTDDCGFSPFCDDTSTTRETAFAKIRARVLGTALACGNARGRVMAADDDEEERLRSVALQNAQSILAARQRAEEALRKQSEWLRITLASIGDAVISTDAEGRVTFLNGVAESLTGWTQAEAAGGRCRKSSTSSTNRPAQPVENPALRALREGTIVGLANHTILIARDGTERPIDDSAAPIRDEARACRSGRCSSFATSPNASGPRKPRRGWRPSSNRPRTRSSARPSTAPSGRGTPAPRLFGYAPQEAIGRPITLIIPPERLDEEREILERLAAGERIEHFETVRIAKDGRRIDISLTISPAPRRRGPRHRRVEDRPRHHRTQAGPQALREREERLRKLADNLPSGFIYQIA